jgi:hypothetical protein
MEHHQGALSLHTVGEEPAWLPVEMGPVRLSGQRQNGLLWEDATCCRRGLRPDSGGVNTGWDGERPARVGPRVGHTSDGQGAKGRGPSSRG